MSLIEDLASGLGSLYESVSEIETTKLAIVGITLLGAAAIAKDVANNGINSATSLLGDGGMKLD